MTEAQRFVSYLIAGALVLTLLPSFALASEEPGAPRVEQPLYYALRAKTLGFPTDTVTARIEVRSGDRVLSSREVLLRFEDRDTLWIPVSPSQEVAPFAADSSDLRVLVFADDRLLDTFDHESLVAYNRNLRFARPSELRTAVGASGTVTLDPGSIDKLICYPSSCGGYCGPYDDYDCDGVYNAIDNCTDDPNHNQADCDGDGVGDVCDVNGIFQPTGPIKTCMADKDDHIVYITFEHHVEQRLVDVSSCNSPDRWNRWVRSSADCFGLSDAYCCSSGIGTSITQVGDDPDLWCGPWRNIDMCH
jgi:hypothetical protein